MERRKIVGVKIFLTDEIPQPQNVDGGHSPSLFQDISYEFLHADGSWSEKDQSYVEEYEFKIESDDYTFNPETKKFVKTGTRSQMVGSSRGGKASVTDNGVLTRRVSFTTLLEMCLFEILSKVWGDLFTGDLNDYLSEDGFSVENKEHD